MKNRIFRRIGFCVVAALSGVAVPQIAQAKVVQVDDGGFVIRHLFEAPADLKESWSELVNPADWWDSTHTWSGDAANLSLDGRAGGCFCEVLPNESSPRAAPRGSVEHMRVVYIEEPRLLRMKGALGPLQGEAVNGTMTIQLKRAEGAEGGTQILMEYVVGGYMRRPAAKMAPLVDAMLKTQLENLVGKLGGAFAQAFPDGNLELDVQGEAAEGKASTTAEGEGAPAPSGVEPLAPEPPKGEAIGR